MADLSSTVHMEGLKFLQAILTDLRELLAPKSIPPYMTLDEVAEFSRFSGTQVRKAISQGTLRATQPEGREYRISRENFIAWMSGSPNKDAVVCEDSTAPVFQEQIKIWDPDPSVDPTKGHDPRFLHLAIPRDYTGLLPKDWMGIRLSFEGIPVFGTVMGVRNNHVVVRVVAPCSFVLGDMFEGSKKIFINLKPFPDGRSLFRFCLRESIEGIPTGELP